MAKGNSISNIPATLFSLGVLIAVVIGAGTAINATWASNAWLEVLLVIIGLVVGFYNVAQKEVTTFLVGTIALIVARGAANLAALDAVIRGLPVGTFLSATLTGFLMVVGAAAVVVSFRAVYGLAK